MTVLDQVWQKPTSIIIIIIIIILTVMLLCDLSPKVTHECVHWENIRLPALLETA